METVGFKGLTQCLPMWTVKALLTNSGSRPYNVSNGVMKFENFKWRYFWYG